jgi:hypothetical protein
MRGHAASARNVVDDPKLSSARIEILPCDALLLGREFISSVGREAIARTRHPSAVIG